MKKRLHKLLAVAGFIGLCAAPFVAVATSFTIDSLDGDITANELKQFTNSINSMVSPTNNWGDAMSTHGTEVEGMRRMYEATGNMNILNRLIVFCDVELSCRNDQPLGDHRTMWDGTVAPGWPEGSTNTTPACTTGMIHGNIAYCATLILQTPSIWNSTIPDGNPNGYGVTYKQRATNYLAKVDSGLSQYLTKWFVNTNTFRIRTPTDSRWLPASGNDTAETAWNRQALFVMAYQYAASCHDILGDNPVFLPLYKGVVNAFATWFTTAYPSGGSQYYTSGGHNVAKWWYQIPTDQHIENIGHAQHDMEGLYQAWESGYTGLTDTQMKVYADTAQFVINLGSTNSWSLNVDGTGTPSTSLKTDFIPLAKWNTALYKMIAQANINANQLNVDEGCKNTGYILYMKRWMYQHTAGSFSLTASPATQTTFPGSNTTFTVTLSTNASFTGGAVTFAVTGLPANVTPAFNPASMGTNGNSTLTLTVGAGAPLGNYPLTILGTNSAATNTTSVTLNIVTPTSLLWTGGSPTTGNWSDSANWNNQILSTGAILTFNGATRLDNTNNTAAGTAYLGMVFNSGSGAFGLNGNPITLTGNITNSSATPQTVNLGLNFNTNLIFNGAGSGLTIVGGLTNTLGSPGSTTLRLAGIGTLKNLLNSTTSPGGTNVISMNSGTANWTLVDNDSSTPITVPWAISITNGTLNFGDDDNAPILNLTAAQAAPTDFEIGRAAGATGTLNMNAGTLTTISRINTGTTVSGSTGVVNQSGGILNIGNQFQGANIAGGNSIVTVSGGVMNINPGSGTNGVFYVASRGTGTLTVSDSGVVNCGTLDISRNASGNTFSSVGEVDLDGGTLMVTVVTNVSANTQTGGAPAATFYFNGGTLVAKPGAKTMFFQGSLIPPVCPITAIVQGGGAVIDDGGNAITIGEPLRHDSTLGGNLDGGLTKLNTGTLNLLTTNTYTGETLVSGGTLALNGGASISNSKLISVSAGATLDASVHNGGALTIVNGQTLTGGGTVKGNITIASGATLAPGGALNTLVFNNNLTLNGGSTTLVEISDTPTTNDAAQVAGNLVLNGTLIVSNVGSNNLTAGDSFKIFSAAGYNGMFTNIQPVIPAVNLAWNTNNLGTGVLSLVSSPTPPPKINAITMSGGSFIFSATNGVPDWPCYILASTNVALPLNQWSVVDTNTFDSNGNFSFTNSPDPNLPQTFYELQLQ